MSIIPQLKKSISSKNINMISGLFRNLNPIKSTLAEFHLHRIKVLQELHCYSFTWCYLKPCELQLL